MLLDTLLPAESNLEHLDAEARAQSALSESPIHALRKLHVERDGDALLISGRVESFYHKQLAQEIVLTVAEDLRVCNCVRVGHG